MADDLVQRLRALSRYEHDNVLIGYEAADALARKDAEIAELRKIAELARKACWLQAACWDLADGSGVFISTESMKRFDEVFTGLGVALGDIVVLDEDAEADMFRRPSELLARAERAEARVGEAPVAVCWTVHVAEGHHRETSVFNLEQDRPHTSQSNGWLGKRVAIVLLDTEEAK